MLPLPIMCMLCGHNERGFGKMYRYDGEQWTPVGLSISEGGTIIKAVDLFDIHGTSAKDIWCVGSSLHLLYDNSKEDYVINDSSFTMHFDGQRWNEYPIEGSDVIISVWCISPTDVWAVGENGTVLHFDGIQWTKEKLDKDYFMVSIAGISKNEVYAVGNLSETTFPIDSTGTFLFHYNGIQWSLIDSVMRIQSSSPVHFGSQLWTNGIEVYSIGPTLFRLSGTTWDKIVELNAGHIFKNSDTHILAVGSSVYLFDGISWKELEQFRTISPMGWSDCYIDSSHAFVLGSNSNVTVVLQGVR